ncbi:hypothetical protein [Phascolarctobacterium succinatutens]|jgi:hypothetical protein|uniref:hypothetical protein n=1 Tax=Phascolarctobacterium succinatutens TaxID=626940 RepID=UPI0026D325A3|nr:hypothetical protein [Phascolarctobacterium succinatutens]
MPGNSQAMHIRELTSNCRNYVAGMAGVYCISYDWPGIESICRMSGIKTNRHIIDRLRKLEDLDIKYLNQKEAAANG